MTDAPADQTRSWKLSRAMFLAGLALVLVVGWLVYRPGLDGAFLFDDFVNLPALGAYGRIDSWAAFVRYITSGIADPTGRPLSLLSFLIDARDWPADPYPFKRTSLVLHLANGALLAWLLLRLGRVHLRDDEGRARAAALVGAALWLLHPLFVSTTLYIVQREAMLPATCALLGLIGYVAGRDRAARGDGSGVFLAALSILAATLFAVASKANGVLIPMLAWLVETIVLAPAQPIADARVAQRFVWMRRVVLALPSVLVLVWLAWTGYGYASRGVPEIRPWTFTERLMTEPRVVVDYLRLLLVPHPYTAGLFNDAYTVSTSLVSPPSTLLAIALLAAMIGGAVAVRRRWPALACAVLFYFAGQLLESTVIPLELYYEHRNYLPALLLFWPVALWLTAGGSLRVVRGALAIALPLLLAGLTLMNADLWGNARDQALLWAEKNPASPRAQVYAAQTERARGNSAAALARLSRAAVPDADDVQIVLNLIGARCDLGAVPRSDVDRAAAALRTARVAGQLGYSWFTQAIDRLAAGQACPGLGADELRELLDAAAANSYARDSYGRRQDNRNLRGLLALALHDPDTALVEFDAALDAKPGPGVALQQAAQLGNAGHPAEAVQHLDHLAAVWTPAPMQGFSMRALHSRLLSRQGYWENEIAHMRTKLAEDIAERAAGGTTP
ncbi:MAG TPA: tetratricopeptide repeat protein [Rhodanobacteraceae bacterium]|nr:tetratricopeptide repeat protein [Rhodanobacteraceae bacterium]